MAGRFADDPESWANALRTFQDVEIASPLWGYPPEARIAVLHERRRRFQNVEEEIGDAEYS